MTAATEVGTEVSGIGIGVPELVSPTGRVTSETVVRWTEVTVVRALAAVAPVRVDADVRCAAVAEASLGAGVGRDSFLYVSVGTGISACFVLDGTPWPGARGNAIVLGSGIGIGYTEEFGELSLLPVEQVASGPALARRYGRARGHDLTRAEEVLERAERGDAAARDTIRVGARVLGARIAEVVNLLDPDSVIVGGGLGSAAGPYWDTMHATVRSLIWADRTRHLPVEQAQLAASSGMIGAALLGRAAGR